MSEVKKKIKQDLYTLNKIIIKQQKDISSLRTGLNLAMADEAERTGKEETKYDKYYR